MKSFLIFLNEKQPLLFNEKLLQEHINYLNYLHKLGALLVCGPMIDNKKAILILRTDSENSVKELVSNDPFIKEGYYKNFKIEEFQEANKENNWLMN